MTQDPIHPMVHPPPEQPHPGWDHSLSRGAAGIALLHIEYARAGVGDWATAHAWATATTRAPVAMNPTSGLFQGAPAVAYALHSAGLSGYAGALGTLDNPITRLTTHRLEHAHARIDRGDLPALGEYDLITGLSGLGTFLLHRHPNGATLRDVLAYLVRLTEPIEAEGEPLPGWWSKNAPTDHPLPDWPDGHANLGLAHGVSGPLALLSIAKKRGIAVQGHTAAIERICTWLDTWRHDNGGPWLPPWVTREDHRTGHSAHRVPLRPSWCYGTPGQARALQLAGQATGNTARQRIAEQALLECITDERQLALLADASLCHGWAGLVHTTWRAAAEALTGALAAHLPELRARLRHHQHGSPGTEDDAGLLVGTAGPALVLHTTATSTPPAPQWDACLLTNG